MRLAFASLTVAAFLAFAPAAHAYGIGDKVPDFTATDTKGQTVHLSDYAGKVVVLEWTNNGCPFVQKHYGTGNMQMTQAAARAGGAVWLSVISSGPGQQGFVDGAEADKLTAERKANPSDVLLDPSGQLGHAFGAKTTPHIFIVDKQGMLAYEGAIDDTPTPNPADLPKAHNYVLAALGDLAAGRAVATPVSQPYGCSVKYTD